MQAAGRGDGHGHQGREPGDDAQPQAGQHDHGSGHHDEHQGHAQRRLDHHQADQRRGTASAISSERTPGPPGSRGRDRTRLNIVAIITIERDLGELRRLDLEAAGQRDPRVRAVDLGADRGEHGQQAEHGRDVEDRRPASAAAWYRRS